MASNKQLLERDLAVAQARTDIGDIQDIVRDMVDEGTQLLARLTMVAAHQGEPRRYHTSLLLLLRHVIEQLDAVDELLREAITVPAMLNVRAIVEAHAQILYMSCEREQFSSSPVDPAVPLPNPIIASTGLPHMGEDLENLRDFRGAAYLVADIRKQLQQAEGFQLGVVEPWLAKLSSKSSGPAMLHDPANQTRLQADIMALKTRLADPENAAVDAEFTLKRGKGRFDPAWYEIQGGPGSVYKLAISVGLVSEYELFYSPASAVMHGQDIRGQLGPARTTGGHGLGQLRSGRNLEMLVLKLIIEIIRVYSHLISLIRPSDKVVWDEWTKRWLDPIRRSVSG